MYYKRRILSSLLYYKLRWLRSFLTLYNKKRVNPAADSSTATLLRLHSSHDASLGIPNNLTDDVYGSTIVIRGALERLPRDSISRV